MTERLEQIRGIYETAFSTAYTDETDRIVRRNEIAVEFGNRLTRALQFPEWKLGTISHELEGVRSSIEGKGDVLIDNDGAMHVVMNWPIEFTLMGEPQTRTLDWRFVLHYNDGNPMVETAESADLVWDFRDDNALSSEVEIVIAKMCQGVAESAASDGRQMALSNHTPRR